MGVGLQPFTLSKTQLHGKLVTGRQRSEIAEVLGDGMCRERLAALAGHLRIEVSSNVQSACRLV